MNNINLHYLDLDIKAEYLTADLITAYHAPIRHYHTLVHALQVATVAKQLMIMSETTCDYGRVMDVYMAGLWHDAIYRPGSPENEVASAGWFSAHYPGRKNVARLISKTTIADHLGEEPVDIQLACLLDADVLSLSAPFDKFMENNTNIIKESGGNHVISSSFLMRFVDKKSIYRTPYCIEHHEEAARCNIKRYYNQSHQYEY
jgi:predicted metal-dependent HD superfamily phosphohydrolase